jgi:hypothetical protein
MVMHPVALRGFDGAGTHAGPALLARQDEDFIDAILDELTTDAGRARLRTTRASAWRDGNLLLYPPIQRHFNLVLLEAHCEQPGNPRLDPRKIDSAGLVVRRVGRPAAAQTQYEGWLSAGPQLTGWSRFATPRALDLDPDPLRRRLSAGHPEIDRRLRMVSALPLAEQATPLFVAPPQVCTAAGRTLLYGLLPVTSSERAQREAAPDFGSDAIPAGDTRSLKSRIRDHLHRYLQPHLPQQALQLPRAGQWLSPSWTEPPGYYADNGLQSFVTLLQQLGVELDAFGSGSAVFAVLNGISIQMYDSTATQPLGQFLRTAKRILIDGEALSLRMPQRWPSLTDAQSAAILDAAVGALTSRFSALAGQRARFDEPGARYVARAFIRVRHEDACPPALTWSAPSAAYAIAPWYEPGGAPPVRVALPKIDRASLAKLKPNVAFELPQDLANVIAANSPKDLVEGKGRKPSGPDLGLDWICGFNIPIITLCAFIVLNIFLQLFDLIFRWLFFVKICIPIPRRRE